MSFWEPCDQPQPGSFSSTTREAERETLGTSLMDFKGMDWESTYIADFQDHFKQHGLCNPEALANFFNRRLDRWQDVEVNIGVTGDSGTGKSSFINAIRGLKDDDEMAAKVGVAETTKVPTEYDHPTNPKIKFWDLPGIGTPGHPDMETYCQKVKLERYDAFLIFTAKRFTENDLKLAKKIRSIDKKFFFIRTHIDENVRAEKRKRSFDESAMLEKIRRDCVENLDDLLNDKQDIFLISNHHPDRWDFDRLTQAILDALPTVQRESLALSLSVLTSLSANMLKRKVEVLEGRIWMVATASAVVGAIPIPGLSLCVDVALILKEITFYRSQLGIPTEGCEQFARQHASTQERIRSICFRTIAQIPTFLKIFAGEALAEEGARFIPIIGSLIASGMSFGTTYYALKQYLKEVEVVALSVLEEAAEKSSRDLDIA